MPVYAHAIICLKKIIFLYEESLGKNMVKGSQLDGDECR